MDLTNSFKQLITLIKSYLQGISYLHNFSEDNLKEVFALAQNHDVAHLVGVASATLPTEERGKYDLFFQAAMKSMLRYEKINAEKQKMYAAFEKAKIAYLPLKGAVICDLYPEPWHRTSCDIDILVREEALEEAVRVLTEELGYRYDRKTEHDISLFSPGGVHIELHYDFHEEGVSTDEVWQSTDVAEGAAYQHVMRGEMFLFCHIAHMEKHFKFGGCGIRPLVDLWILNRHMPYDKKKLDALLCEKGLSKFAETIFRLTEAWFSDGAMDDLLERTGDYILGAGVYGSVENRATIGRMKKKGRVRYILARIFLPYERMKYPYPILEKYRYLLPFCQVHRWIRLLRDKKLHQAREEFKKGESGSENAIGALFKELNIQ